MRGIGLGSAEKRGQKKQAPACSRLGLCCGSKPRSVNPLTADLDGTQDAASLFFSVSLVASGRFITNQPRLGTGQRQDRR